MNENQPFILSMGGPRPASPPATLSLGTNTPAVPVQLDAPRVYHLSEWGRLTDPQRLAWLRNIARQRGRDPRIRELAFRLIAGAPERDYPAQAARLLKAVQPGGGLMAYVNEPGEVLQDPLYTLRVKAGDCDDAALLLASLFEAVRLPWRFVLSGRRQLLGDSPAQATGERLRHIEGETYPSGRIKWGHIYCRVGWPVFAPTTWAWAEPTMRYAPLGWDVQSHLERTGNSVLPELGDAGGSPSLAAGAGAVVGSTQRTVVETVIVAVATSVIAAITVEYLRKKGVIPSGSSCR